MLFKSGLFCFWRKHAAAAWFHPKDSSRRFLKYRYGTHQHSVMVTMPWWMIEVNRDRGCWTKISGSQTDHYLFVIRCWLAASFKDMCYRIKADPSYTPRDNALGDVGSSRHWFLNVTFRKKDRSIYFTRLSSNSICPSTLQLTYHWEVWTSWTKTYVESIRNLRLSLFNNNNFIIIYHHRIASVPAPYR
jgi:hypothetical protein